MAVAFVFVPGGEYITPISLFYKGDDFGGGAKLSVPVKIFTFPFYILI